MQPAPLTSGGLALEEVTCRGWGPHLQYSFLIKLASLSGKYPAGRPAKEAKYHQLRMHVDVYVHAALRDNMLENAAGKCTGREISLFRAESTKVVSCSDYHA